MRAFAKPLATPTPGLGLLPRLLVPGYAATMFLSAGLLFLVQPMVTKMVLPHLGGSPSVWNTCMCFFQAALLCGYLYAHLLTKYCNARAQGVIHGIVLAGAAAFLPLDLTGAAPLAGEVPIVWLIARLATTVGPPFLALSATAPLLQRWFSQADHPFAADPYFLYAASNAGSLLALLAYPIAVEPNSPLTEQSSLWAAGLAFVAAGIVACWLGLRRNAAPMAAAPVETAARPRTGERLRWVGYAFVPSSLLLAVTAHITTDLASAPLFWIIPLALYLATFILTFARRPVLPQGWMVRALPLLIIPLVVLSAVMRSIWLMPLHLAVFFVIAMICHGELSRRRPGAADLTEFYLCVSLGGVLGGIFVAIVAPLVFPDIWEYPLMLVAACLARPGATRGGRAARTADFAGPAILLAGLVALLHVAIPGWATTAALAIAAVVLLQFSERRVRFALGIAACALFVHVAASGGTLMTARSFFGVYRVAYSGGDTIRVLQHGTTVHGAESTVPGRETVPLAYYNPEGPFGRFFAALAGHAVRNVGVVGLGTGALACYARPGQNWTFHEIDPLVVQIARDPRYFHFLDKCGNDPRLVLGDARLTLQAVPDYAYDVIIIDAFSSDSIPLHLLTREALALYQRKLSADGVILFHISNRYLDLAPVIAALARDAGAPACDLLDIPVGPPTVERLATEVVAVGRPGASLAFLPAADGWRDLPPTPTSALWTDQRSDIVSRIKWY